MSSSRLTYNVAPSFKILVMSEPDINDCVKFESRIMWFVGTPLEAREAIAMQSIKAHIHNSFHWMCHGFYNIVALSWMNMSWMFLFIHLKHFFWIRVSDHFMFGFFLWFPFKWRNYLHNQIFIAVYFLWMSHNVRAWAVYRLKDWNNQFNSPRSQLCQLSYEEIFSSELFWIFMK